MALPSGFLGIIDHEREYHPDRSCGEQEAERARDIHREKCLWGAHGK
jgi:hypothetical protein